MTVLEGFSGWILSFNTLEAFAAVLGLAYLLLAVQRNLWCWLCAFVSTAIYLVIFYEAALYMHTALQVFYLSMAVYGFVEWRRGKDEHGSVRIRSWSMGAHALAALLIVLATAINGWMLSRYSDAAAPYLDSFVTWGSVVTTWMVARRLIENWAYWMVIDSAAAYLYFSQQLYATALLFILYVLIVIRGHYVWHRERATQAGLQPS